MSARAAPVVRISEADFTATVIELAQLAGWRCAHFRPCRSAPGWRTAVQGDGIGFPDLVLLKPPRLILVELKAEDGRISTEQRAWLNELQDTPIGEAVGVWRPSDMTFIRHTLGIDAARPA